MATGHAYCTLGTLLLVVSLALGAQVVSAQTLTAPAAFCSDPTVPVVDGLFSALQGALPDQLGAALDCAHPVLAGEAVIQHVANGTLVLNATSGDVTFTDGAEFWTLSETGDLIDTAVPPSGVLPALSASVAPTATPTPTPPGTPRAAATDTSATLLPTPTPTSVPTVATPTPVPSYRPDPYTLAITLADLPNGGQRAWLAVKEDTTHLAEYGYSQVFGRHPDNGAPFPLDPTFVVNIKAVESVDLAQATWDEVYSKPSPGERPGATLAPFADEQFYALAPNLIDVRARFQNVIFQVIETTSGASSISLDDSVTLVRIMISRASAAAPR